MESACIQCLFIETKKDMIYVHTDSVYTHQQLLSSGTAKLFRLIRDCEGLPIPNTDRRNSESIRMSQQLLFHGMSRCFLATPSSLRHDNPMPH